MDIKIGAKYRHFKGHEYEVVFIARDSEDPERELVVYRDLHAPEKVWVRPKDMFLENVDKPEFNYKGPRFAPINNGN